MKAKLCATVVGTTTEELRANRDRAKGADLVELRLDFVQKPDVPGALADRRCPVVVTCRPTWEGGHFDGAEEDRRQLLIEALNLGADYVDLEWKAGFEDLITSQQGRRIVLSMHDFNGLPNDLTDQYRAMRSTGAEVVKIAVRTDSLSSLLKLRNIETLGAEACRVIVGMGAAGILSRLLPDRFGSHWTYAGEGVAPGQLGLKQMLEEFRIKDISETTELYGVLGKPLRHSLSPSMHNAGFAFTGRDAVYLPLEAMDVDDFVAFSKVFSMKGLSVTAPYKEEVTKCLVEEDDLSRRVGAVNTIQINGTTWIGCNTDVQGFLEPLVGRFPLSGCRAAVLGAGGAARGVAIALSSQGAIVTVCARDAKKAESVARLIDGDISSIPPAAGSWDLLINTTPIGTYPQIEETPMPNGVFDGKLVYDLVYNPSVTRLMTEAMAAGCETVGGISMLVEQAIRQAEWWTGIRPPRKIFEDAAKKHLDRLRAEDEL